MILLAMLPLSTTDNGTTRLILFVLVIVAVLLILAGCIIAVLTLFKKRKVENDTMNSHHMESESI